jgi:hypothetical protein
VIEVEHHRGWGLWVTGNTVVHEGAGEALEVVLVYVVLQTRQGRGTGSIGGRLQGRPLHPELEHGVSAETIGVIGIRIPCGDLLDTLGEEVPQRVVDIGLMTLITHRRREALGQANLPVNPSE